MNYGVKNKVTGLWFGGFDVQRNAMWVNESNATVMSKLFAQTQASLLRRDNANVQNRPVKVAA